MQRDSAVALELYAKKPLAIDNKMLRPLVDQDRDNPNLSLDRFYRDIEQAFGWLGANPSDSKRASVFKTLYIHPRVDTQAQAVADKLTKCFQDVSISSGLIHGKRGSGKTMLTNYVLTVNHTLLQEASTTWLRADIAKLHAINEELISTNRGDFSTRLTISKYMAIHAFSVMLEYGPRDEVFKSLFTSEESFWELGSFSGLEQLLSEKNQGYCDCWRRIRKLDQERRQRVKHGTLKKQSVVVQ